MFCYALIKYRGFFYSCLLNSLDQLVPLIVSLLRFVSIQRAMIGCSSIKTDEI